MGRVDLEASRGQFLVTAEQRDRARRFAARHGITEDGEPIRMLGLHPDQESEWPESTAPTHGKLSAPDIRRDERVETVTPPTGEGRGASDHRNGNQP